MKLKEGLKLLVIFIIGNVIYSISTKSIRTKQRRQKLELSFEMGWVFGVNAVVSSANDPCRNFNSEVDSLRSKDSIYFHQFIKK